jgi:hypothetical protein
MMEIAMRWSGLIMIMGAALFGTAVVFISFKPVVNQSFSPTISLLLLLASVCLLLSVPGMYFKQADAAGSLGLAGYVLLQTGILLLVVIAAPALLYPSLNQAPGENVVFFVLGIAFTLGLLLTGVATLQAGIYPRWAGILLLAATAGFFFVFFIAEFLPAGAGQIGSAIFGVLLALALAWIGLAMWTSQLGHAG